MYYRPTDFILYDKTSRVLHTELVIALPFVAFSVCDFSALSFAAPCTPDKRLVLLFRLFMCYGDESGLLTSRGKMVEFE